MAQSRDFKYSYSGADITAFVYFPDYPVGITPLSSVHTISVSVHEAKGQARALGFRGIKGLARGVRTIAGSMILTVINNHPLKELHDQYNSFYTKKEPSLGWSVDRNLTGVGTLLNNYDYSNRLATLLPPFNMALQFVSESTSGASFFEKDPQGRAQISGAGCLIANMEFLDEGQVSSVSDTVTEMSFSFIATDFKPISEFSHTVEEFTSMFGIASQIDQRQSDLFTLLSLNSTYVADDRFLVEDE